MDEWPNLPGLRESAKRGCGFCAFLREAIMSNKFKDAWGDFTEEMLAKANLKRLSLELWYDTDFGPHLPLTHSWTRPQIIDYLTVRCKFETGLEFHLHFELEGVPGE